MRYGQYAVESTWDLHLRNIGGGSQWFHWKSGK